MTYLWYREVTSADSISQGDILEDLPVLTFRNEVTEAADLEAMKHGLQNAAGVRAVRAVVMTQACDIEQGKVRYIHLCPAFTLAEFKNDWKRTLEAQNQNPTDKAWRNTCEQIRTGRVWNYTMLNERIADADGLSQEFLIVDFHEVFSLPIGFLRSWVRARGTGAFNYALRTVNTFLNRLLGTSCASVCQSTSDLQRSSVLYRN